MAARFPRLRLCLTDRLIQSMVNLTPKKSGAGDQSVLGKSPVLESLYS